MFTGIIEEIGVVAGLARDGDSAVLSVRASVVADDVRHGASIAVNGVCLTVVGRHRAGADGDGSGDAAPTVVDFDVMGETLQRSGIGRLEPGDPVNLERAVRADGRLDGHVVAGHVDATGAVLARTPGTQWETVRFALPAALTSMVAEKGSVAVDGVSLTVSGIGEGWFEVGLIPETLRATTLGARGVGDEVNLEIDVLARYVARLLAVSNA